jgi:branched-subunit amino acid aminotransferase/4-amino-4-deoxychorismate lyase
VRADDSAYAEGRGCYSTVRIDAGRPRFASRHIARLQAGTRELGLGSLDEARVLAALDELASAAFTDSMGIIRLQASRDATGLRLIGIPRSLGNDPDQWTATRFAVAHPGPSAAHGLKVTNRLTLALAREAAQGAGVDEAILFDIEQRLVEGARSNLFCVLRDGTLATPPIDSGAVDGIARAVCLERLAEIEERTIPVAELARASELIAVNAIRGAKPIITLDGRPVGSGSPGPGCERLADVLAAG